MILLLKKYFKRMDKKFPIREFSMSRKHTILHLLARFLKSPDMIKYIYKMIIDTEIQGESFYRQNMNIFYLLGGKYWPMYNVEMPSMNMLTSMNIFREKLPMDKNMEWVIKNGRILVPNYNTRKTLMQQIVIIGTPGLFNGLDYYDDSFDGYTVIDKKEIIKFINSIMNPKKPSRVPYLIEYNHDDLYDDYEIFLETGIPISIL